MLEVMAYAALIYVLAALFFLSVWVVVIAIGAAISDKRTMRNARRKWRI